MKKLIFGIVFFTSSTAFSASTFDDVVIESSCVLSSESANTVPYLNGSKELVSSAITSTELGYLSGVSSAIQNQLNGKEPAISVLPINKGGTGQSTANGSLNAFLPSQGGNTGKFLQTDGVNSSWQVSTGTVTSVTASLPLTSSGGGTPNLSIPAATDSVNGYLSSNDHATFNSKLGSVSTSQMVYVYKNGNDFTCLVNRVDLPCLTVNKAMSLITDAGVSKKYIIQMGPGTFTETSLSLKPYVAIFGYGDLFGGSTVMGLSSGTINIDSSAATVSGRYGLFNLAISSSANLNLDFQTVGGGFSEVVEIHNVSINGNIVFKGKNSSDFASIDSSFVHGTLTFSGGTTGISNTNVVGNAQLDTSGNVDLTTLITSSVFYSDFKTTSFGGGHTVLAQLIGSGTTTMHIDTTSSFLYSDAVSLPSPKSSLILTNGGAYTLTTDAYMESYSPSLPSNWSVVPSSVDSALDKLVVLQQSALGSRPLCSSSNRGLMWLVQGGSGVADLFQVCMKDATDSYSWMTK